MNILLTTPDEVRTLAENYTPDDLPPKPILQDWLKLSNAKMTMAELTTDLKTGKTFMFAEGGLMLEWSEK